MSRDWPHSSLCSGLGDRNSSEASLLSLHLPRILGCLVDRSDKDDNCFLRGSEHGMGSWFWSSLDRLGDFGAKGFRLEGD